jgi:hypothetical protein
MAVFAMGGSTMLHAIDVGYRLDHLEELSASQQKICL